MKITFIMPSVGKQKKNRYVKSWKMEPLAIAVLSELTPPDIEKDFFDDRLEPIDYDAPTDLVAITLESYTAKRAYQIAQKYRQNKVPVIMGGFHASLCTEEVLEHADAVVLGEAEGVWGDILNDARAGQLKKKYDGFDKRLGKFVRPDRSIYGKKKYMAIKLVETGRGCSFDCEFCSVSRFYKRTYSARPIQDIVEEIKALGTKIIFFVDDNIVVDRARAVELFKALAPLKIRWVSQVSMNIYKDAELLKLMKKSGCAGVLIGFESLNKESLQMMGKNVNLVKTEYAEVVKAFHKNGLAIYATFIFGYNDTEQDFKEVYDFGIKNKLFYVTFNHVVPFPGTPLYKRLQGEGRLIYDKWWLTDDLYFGKLTFRPKKMTPESLAETCFNYRYKYFGLRSIFKRIWSSFYLKNPLGLLVFLYMNFTANRDTKSRQQLLIGGITK